MARRLLLALIAVVCCAAVAPRPAGASFPGYVTYRADAGGGTISITFTDDLTGVTRIALDGVTFVSATTPCNGTVTHIRYFDPPDSVMGGGFSASLARVGLFTGDYVTVSGSVTDGAASGSASYGGGTPSVSCKSEPLSFVGTGPVDTPPTDDDLRYVGAVEGAAGDFEIRLSPQRDADTSATFRSLLMPCEEAVALSVAAFFEPPVPIDPETREFTFVVVAHMPDSGSPIIRGVFLSGVAGPEGMLQGTVVFNQISPFCQLSDVPWSAQLVPATPTPTPSATPPPATPSPTSGSAPIALPDAGTGAGGGGTTVLFAIAALFATGALCAGGVLMRAPRR